MKFDPEQVVKQGIDIEVDDENDQFFKNYTHEVLNDILTKKPNTNQIRK